MAKDRVDAFRQWARNYMNSSNDTDYTKLKGIKIEGARVYFDADVNDSKPPRWMAKKYFDLLYQQALLSLFIRESQLSAEQEEKLQSESWTAEWGVGVSGNTQ